MENEAWSRLFALFAITLLLLITLGMALSIRGGLRGKTIFATSRLSPEMSLRIEFGRRNNRPCATGSLFVRGAFSAD
jgi:hypothetical protein